MSNPPAPDPGKTSPVTAGVKRPYEADTTSFLRPSTVDRSCDSEICAPGASNEPPDASATNLDFNMSDDVTQSDFRIPSTQEEEPAHGVAATNLNEFLKQSSDPETARLADVVCWCDKISGTLHEILTPFSASHPKEGDFLRSWLSVGVGRIIQGKTDTVPQNSQTSSQPSSDEAKNTGHSKPSKKSYAAAALATGSEPDEKRRVLKATPPRKQGDNDRRVMIRLAANHPARAMEAYAVREKIRTLVKDPKLVVDVWHVNSGVTILTPSPAKAAQVLQDSDKLKTELTAEKVEQQDNWTTHVIGPVMKRQKSWDTILDVTEDMVKAELEAATEDKIPIQALCWTKRTADPHLAEGYIRACVKTSHSGHFPSRLRLFGRPVSVLRIKAKPTVHHCTRCHGFHHERTCARLRKCGKCGESDHADAPCSKPDRCLNCRGPYPSDHAHCPAAPKVISGKLVTPPKRELRAIRTQGGREYLIKYPKAQNDESSNQTQTVGNAESANVMNRSNNYDILATPEHGAATDNTAIHSSQ